MSAPLRVVRDGDVVRLTLDRPDKGNALAPDLVEALIAAVGAAAHDGTRLLVIAGTGKHLCTGFDLGGLESLSDGDLLLRMVRIETLLQALYDAPCVTVAIGTGRVTGAGADIFTACDRRLAVDGSAYTFPGAGFGILLGTGRLAARVGADAARDILRSGQVLSVDAAVRAGLATEAVSPADIETRIAIHAESARRLDGETVGAIHAVTRRTAADTDLAVLVRSASRPGLKDRILAYRVRTLGERQKGTA